MAKDQDLPVNPLRIAGACGRLMCCLKYEHPLYQEFREKAPALGESVETPDGPGVVTGHNVPGDKVVVKLTRDGRKTACSRASVCGSRKAYESTYADGPRPGASGGGCAGPAGGGGGGGGGGARGRGLWLAVARLPGTGAGPGIGSLVINPGGPGDSGVGYALQARSMISAAVRAQFDVVGFDPRGVGGSVPAVHCMTGPQLDRYYETDDTPANLGQLASVVSESRLFP